MKKPLHERSGLNAGSVPSMPKSSDINLYDSVWNYNDGDSVDDLVKASLLFYTQHARELGAESASDPKVLNKLVQRLERKRVPEDVIEKIVFRLRLKDKQVAKGTPPQKAKMKIGEIRQIIREALGSDEESPDQRFARWEQWSQEESVKPFIDAIKNAEDPKALAKAKRAAAKADDEGLINLIPGAFFHFLEKRKEELSSLNYQPSSAEASRADRILRVRDSSGRAKARKF